MLLYYYYTYFWNLDPSHMLKLARNALGSLSSFTDHDGNSINWHYFQHLNNIQEDSGMKLGNELSVQHLKYQTHKMNVSLAAQTLSASVANAIEFLNISLKKPQFQGSEGTVKFTRTIDRLFDILNSRNVTGKGYKQPLRLKSQHVWEPILRSTADYLLGLKTNNTNTGQLLATHKRKTFVIGFVATIKTIIEMANEMFKLPENPFQYILTYRFSQDHIELLFSCIRSKGGWNNNPNVSQLKYALRKMLLRNAVTASRNANCVNWMENFSGIIPFFHKKKHTSPIDESLDDASSNENTDFPQEVKMIGAYLSQNKHTEFLSNILFYVGGYIASKLVKLLTCSDCKKCLLSLSPTTSQSDHDYRGVKSIVYDQVSAASAFTLFVNNGGLKIPSKSVYQVIYCAENVFREFVPEHRNQINHEKNLKTKMIIKVCQYFILEQSNLNLFHDHDEGMHEDSLQDDHRINLTKHVADKYFTLRLFSYGKQYCKNIIKNGEPSRRHQLTKLILFKNE